MDDAETKDHTAAIAEALFIANLLFVGVLYIALWGLYFFRYKQASHLAKCHLSQAVIVSSFSTIIFILINVFIVVTDGYHSLTALFSLELYFMVVVPLFLFVGIVGFSKAIKGQDYSYPFIGQHITC